jgi:hypothetical protein
MTTHAFLSPEWVQAARQIQAEHLAEAERPLEGIRINFVVRDVPFEAARVDAHLDTSSGEWIVELGHLERADVKVTLGYADAKAILVDGNQDVALQAFMGGRIQIEGDMGKLLQFQAQPQGPVQQKMLDEVRAVTS